MTLTVRCFICPGASIPLRQWCISPCFSFSPYFLKCYASHNARTGRPCICLLLCLPNRFAVRLIAYVSVSFIALCDIFPFVYLSLYPSGSFCLSCCLCVRYDAYWLSTCSCFIWLERCSWHKGQRVYSLEMPLVITTKSTLTPRIRGRAMFAV